MSQKDDLLALVQKQMADELASVSAVFQPILDAVAALEVLPAVDPAVADLQAQIADLKLQLSDKSAALDMVNGDLVKANVLLAKVNADVKAIDSEIPDA